MNISNARSLTVTTQSEAHRLCDYTLNCERIKQDRLACGITTPLAAAGGAAIGGVVAYNTAGTVGKTVVGAFGGMSVGICFSFTMCLCVNACEDNCDYITLRNREIATSTELGPLAVSQQHKQEPLTAEPPPNPGTGSIRTAPVQSQPGLYSSSLLPSIGNVCSLHPTTYAISEIVSGRSTSEVASGAYRLTSGGSTSLGLPGFGFW
ncbi:hypothetical protein J7438_12415 [Thalassotalea sp. G20_0]|uniref:hypothetical protein n=1 Tax=Thalassotalea sp. G20_0 TaxID=2821093 RepID=UPI001ADD0192|nr:hypothetical protein [Thalassotalea sp. G20_0]MBO9494880.1 hypothetical protein [Thalassotalea sp. G20_0]